MNSEGHHEFVIRDAQVSRAFPGTARRMRRGAFTLLAASVLAMTWSGEIGAALHVLPTTVMNVLYTGSLFAAVILLASPFVRTGSRRRAARVRATRDGIEVTDRAGTRRYARDDLSHGLSSTTSASAEFVRRNGNVVRVDVRSSADVESLVAAAGLDASQQAVEFSTSQAVDTVARAIGLTVMGACFGGLAALWSARLSSALPEYAFFTTWIGSVVLTMLATARPRIAIGTDGLRVKRPLATEFLPFAEITTTLEDDRNLVIVRGTQGPLRFDLGGLEVRDRIALFDRITQARAASLKLHSDPASAPQLERKGRSLGEWTRDLVKLVTHGGDYRTSPLSADELARIVNDPSASAERRIGAAVALSGSHDEAATTRVRVAADACVSEPVKRALHKAVDGQLDDDDVAAAIEADVARRR